MKIMILGARGMLGTDLLPILSPDHEVSCRDIQEFDITDRKVVREQIAACRPQVLINAAAFTDVDKCESERELAFAVNAEGALNIALGCRDAECAMVHLSTDYVFDGQSRTPYPPEGVRPHPLNVYGASKLKGEEYIQEVLQDHLIIRTEWLYGRNGKNFVDTILRLASGQDELRVVNDQRGSPTFTRDLARAIGLLLGSGARGVLHATNSGECTWFEFARKVLELKPPQGRTVRVIPISSAELPRPAKRPSYSVLDCSRLEDLTGKGMRPWEEALREYLAIHP